MDSLATTPDAATRQMTFQARRENIQPNYGAVGISAAEIQAAKVASAKAELAQMQAEANDRVSHAKLMEAIGEK
jgi:hypothetical protein